MDIELRKSLCSKMTTLNLYYNETFSYEGDMTECYFTLFIVTGLPVLFVTVMSFCTALEKMIYL